MSEQNPYRPPEAHVADVLGAPPKGFRWLPIFVCGLGLDVAGTVVLSLIFAILFLALGYGPAEVEAMMSDPNVPAFWALSLAGMGLTVLSGYVAARWAGVRFLLHAGATGGVSFLAVLGMSVGVEPSAVSLFAYVAHFPLVLLGGHLAARQAPAPIV